MQNIELFVTDLDGTLLLEDHNAIGERTLHALRALKERGVKLCACTGRLLSMMPTDFAAWGFDYVVTSNGAACRNLQTNERVFERYMPLESAVYAWNLLEKESCMIEWFVGDEVLMDGKNWAQWKEFIRAPWHWTYFGEGRGIHVEDVRAFFAQGAPRLEKINIMACPPGLRERAIEPMLSTGRYDISTSLGYNYEITDAAANKGDGVRSLCSHLGIDPASVVAFGDGGNDLKMFDAAGVSVAMGNASEEVKSRARYVALSNTEEGIAAFLEENGLL